MKKVIIKTIEFYQKKISIKRTSCCKFYPTCSNYGKEAIEKFGVFIGSVLTLYRILRCNSFSIGGYDPVPKKFINKINNRRHTENGDF